MSESLMHDVVVKCSITHAFDVFTSRVDLWWPKGHRKFDQSELQHEVRAGGQLVERAQNGEVFKIAEIVDFDPPHQITFEWHPGKITKPTKTVVTFAAQGAHETQVRVVHTEGDADMGEAWPQRAQMFNKGWQILLPALQTYINLEGEEE